MNRKHKYILKIAVVALVLCFLAVFGVHAQIQDKSSRITCNYLKNMIKSPGVSETGGDWFIMALARSEYNTDKAYIDVYYENVKKTVAEKKGDLSRAKVTDNCRVILALTAAEKDVRNIGGYDLFSILYDFDRVTKQGLNGPVWTLLAFDSGNYEIPENVKLNNPTSRRKIIDYILEKQLPDGGWNFACKGSSDTDMTAMVLQALAKYQDEERVKTAVNSAITFLSAVQNNDGGFETGGIETSESISQVITALSELGIPLTDERFIKNRKSAKDALLSYMQEDGSFQHIKSGGTDMMASEQAFYALIASERAEEGKTSMYRMW